MEHPLGMKVPMLPSEKTQCKKAKHPANGCSKYRNNKGDVVYKIQNCHRCGNSHVSSPTDNHWKCPDMIEEDEQPKKRQRTSNGGSNDIRTGTEPGTEQGTEPGSRTSSRIKRKRDIALLTEIIDKSQGDDNSELIQKLIHKATSTSIDDTIPVSNWEQRDGTESMEEDKSENINGDKYGNRYANRDKREETNEEKSEEENEGEDSEGYGTKENEPRSPSCSPFCPPPYYPNKHVAKYRDWHGARQPAKYQTVYAAIDPTEVIQKYREKNRKLSMDKLNMMNENEHLRELLTDTKTKYNTLSKKLTSIQNTLAAL